MWDAVLPLWLDLALADSEVASVLGDSPPAVYLVGERDRQVPAMEYTLVVAGLETEVYESSLVQLDLWTATIEQLVTLEKALRRLLHHDTTITLGGIKILTQLTGGRPLAGADRDGALNHSLDFRLQYLRGKYS